MKKLKINKPKVTVFIAAIITVVTYLVPTMTDKSSLLELATVIFFVARLVIAGGFINISFSLKQTNPPAFFMSLISAIGFGLASFTDMLSYYNDYIELWTISEKSINIISFITNLSFSLAFFFLGVCLLRARDMATKVDGVLLLFFSYPYISNTFNYWSAVFGKNLYKLIDILVNNVFVTGFISFKTNYSVICFIIETLLFAVASLSIPSKK